MHATVDALTHATVDGRFTLYRLLLCAPFSAFDVRQSVPGGMRDAHGQRLDNAHDLPLGHALGSLLDSTVLPRRYLRRLANVWTSWSAREIKLLVGLHSCARRCFRKAFPCCCGRAPGSPACDAGTAVVQLHEFTDINEADVFAAGQ